MRLASCGVVLSVEDGNGAVGKVCSSPVDYGQDRRGDAGWFRRGNAI